MVPGSGPIDPDIVLLLWEGIAYKTSRAAFERTGLIMLGGLALRGRLVGDAIVDLAVVEAAAAQKV